MRRFPPPALCYAHGSNKKKTGFSRATMLREDRSILFKRNRMELHLDKKIWKVLQRGGQFERDECVAHKRPTMIVCRATDTAQFAIRFSVALFHHVAARYYDRRKNVPRHIVGGNSRLSVHAQTWRSNNKPKQHGKQNGLIHSCDTA